MNKKEVFARLDEFQNENRRPDWVEIVAYALTLLTAGLAMYIGWTV